MKTLNKQALYGALATRYDVGFAQGIADHIEKLSCRDSQFLDIKELNDLTAEYRSRIRNLIAACRATDRDSSTVRKAYASYERIFARRQLADLWQLYRTAYADSRELTAAYMTRLQAGHHPASRFNMKQYKVAA